MTADTNEFGVTEIPDHDLSEEHLPPPNADCWSVIAHFALTFDGYGHWGSFDKCGDIANAAAERYQKTGQLPESLTNLRTCLFFEQRRWRHFDESPRGDDLRYIHAVVEAIREKVRIQRPG